MIQPKGSPSIETRALERRRIEHKISLEDIEVENNWNSCCSNQPTDSRLLKFITRFSISLLTLSMSFYGLVNAKECDNLVPFWSGLITFVVGLNINPEDRKFKVEK